MKVINTNNYNVRVLFELHGIFNARIRVFEGVVQKNDSRHFGCVDMCGVVSVFNTETDREIYWTNTSGHATIKVSTKELLPLINTFYTQKESFFFA